MASPSEFSAESEKKWQISTPSARPEASLPTAPAESDVASQLTPRSVALAVAESTPYSASLATVESKLSQLSASKPAVAPASLKAADV